MGLTVSTDPYVTRRYIDNNPVSAVANAVMVVSIVILFIFVAIVMLVMRDKSKDKVDGFYQNDSYFDNRYG